MHRLQLSEDIRPLSEFRANVASFIQQVRRTNRPLVITHHGKSTAVLMNVSEYEALLERLDLLGEIREAEKQLAAGQGVTQAAVKKRILQNVPK